MSNNINNIWMAVKNKIDFIDPNYLELNTAATDAQILNVEQNLGCVIPNEFKDLLKINNGQPDTAVFFLDNYLLSTDTIYPTWLSNRDIYAPDGSPNGLAYDTNESVGKVKLNEIWRVKWIPFCNSADTTYCIDLDPDTSGQEGQILKVEITESQVNVVATDLCDFFDKIKVKLEANDYDYFSEVLEVGDVNFL